MERKKKSFVVCGGDKILEMAPKILKVKVDTLLFLNS